MPITTPSIVSPERSLLARNVAIGLASVAFLAFFDNLRLRGATASAAGDRWISGAGRALRSTLPLGVSGIAGSTTRAAGSMCSGSERPRASRMPPSSGAGPAVALATT